MPMPMPTTRPSGNNQQEFLTEVKKVFPEGACDTHFHVFGQAEEFPFIEDRSYTPPPASIGEYWSAFKALGVDRCVLVQPSVYGRDHSLLKQTLRRATPGSMRGVAVIFEDTEDSEIEELHNLGVRGARCNALFSGGVSASNLQSIANRVKNLGWHIQLLVNVDTDPCLVERVADMGVAVVVDHFGHPTYASDINRSGIQNLRSLVKEGRAWVKLSGAYRLSGSASVTEPAAMPLARLFADANSNRILWGSDWPHPGFDRGSISSAELARTFTHWIADEEIRKKASVANPSQLYWDIK